MRETTNTGEEQGEDDRRQGQLDVPDPDRDLRALENLLEVDPREAGHAAGNQHRYKPWKKRTPIRKSCTENVPRNGLFF